MRKGRPTGSVRFKAMRILTCVKQVPESAAAVRLDENTGRAVMAPSSGFRMNRFDEFAVEAALRIKETRPDTLVDVLSVGPRGWTKVIRRALGMGADRGIHVLAEPDEPPCPFVRAAWIAACVRDRPYDLILTGAMAEDDMHAQVGPLLAELLSMPCAAWVVALDPSPQNEKARTVQVEREVGPGMREVLELDLPAVLTVQMGINRPRYPSLSHMMRAHRRELETIQASNLAPVEPRQVQVRAARPVRTRDGLVLQGSLEEKAARLVETLRSRALME